MKEKIVILVVLTVMIILTATYAVYVVYSTLNNTNDWHLFDYYEPDDHDRVYYAQLYEEEPSQWYYPQDLAIGGYWDNDGNCDNGFWIVVDRDKEPFDLQAANPVFKLYGKFYQVSSFWATPALPKEPLDIGIVGGAAGISIGWCFTGILCYRWRKHEKTN